MKKTAKYLLNGFYYYVNRIEEKDGLVYLQFGLNTVPVRISDVTDIG